MVFSSSHLLEEYFIRISTSGSRLNAVAQIVILVPFRSRSVESLLLETRTCHPPQGVSSCCWSSFSITDRCAEEKIQTIKRGLLLSISTFFSLFEVPTAAHVKNTQERDVLRQPAKSFFFCQRLLSSEFQHVTKGSLFLLVTDLSM